MAEWEHACQLGLEPDTRVQFLADDETPYPASVPGGGKYLADHELDTAGAITLGDLMLAAGPPQAGCLDYGLLHQEPVIWVRLVLADGRVEAYTALSVSSQRLALDAPVYVLYCYHPGANDIQFKMNAGRGLPRWLFTAIARMAERPSRARQLIYSFCIEDGSLAEPLVWSRNTIQGGLTCYPTIRFTLNCRNGHSQVMPCCVT